MNYRYRFILGVTGPENRNRLHNTLQSVMKAHRIVPDRLDGQIDWYPGDPRVKFARRRDALCYARDDVSGDCCGYIARYIV